VTAVGQTGAHIVLTTLPPNSTRAARPGTSNAARTDQLVPGQNWDQNYTFDDTNLQPLTVYSYRYSLRNGEGVQGRTPVPETDCADPAGVPLAPVTARIWRSSSSWISWWWMSRSVRPATSFTILGKRGGDADGRRAGYVETGLAENTVYSRHVHGTNAVARAGLPDDHVQYDPPHPVASDLTLTATSGRFVAITVVPPLNPTVGIPPVKSSGTTPTLEKRGRLHEHLHDGRHRSFGEHHVLLRMRYGAGLRQVTTLSRP